jgi:F0F1-type ATP synthase epsilon subunit
MLLVLSTPEYNNLQSNVTKVRVHLRKGIAEILDQHQDLMGKVENDLVEIETNFENKVEKSLFVLQEAVFIVSNKGLDGKAEKKETGVYIYARKAVKLGKNISTDALSEEYERKTKLLETERESLRLQNEKLEKAKFEKRDEKAEERLTMLVSSTVLLLQEDVEFLRKALLLAKNLKL